MTMRTVAIEGPSETVVETALDLIQRELLGHFWVHNATKLILGELPCRVITPEELQAILHEHVRPILEKYYLLPTSTGDSHDKYTPLDKLTEVYMAIGYACAVTGYPPISNARQITGLRDGLEWALEEIEWGHDE